jgi:dTDP-4-dehydrorhamnose reductase
MKVTVLGASGMLGGMVTRILKSRGNDVRAVGRDMFDIIPTTESVIGVKLYRSSDDDTQYVINCIGAIKSAFAKPENHLNAIYTNAIFPRQLANVCEKTNKKLIHITTDCVFDGKDGPYDETREHNATDEYGKSKSLGEPTNCLVLRTSIIGPEFGGRKRSLLEWVRGQEGKQINGFENHLWNGLTTMEMAKVLDRIISNNLYKTGTFHVHSTDISKTNLLLEIIAAYHLNISVKPTNAPQNCDRRLRSIKDINLLVAPTHIHYQLEELSALNE